MIKSTLEFLLVLFLKMAFWFRYRMTVKGLDNLNKNTLNKPGGVLFLPNHPTVFVDSTMIVMSLWPRFDIRPMIVEYMYYLPIVHSIMRFLDAIPIPNFSTSSNSLKRKKSEKVFKTVIEDLQQGNNFLIYPAGRLKLSAHEALNGASGVHQIIQERPDTNIVLVRVKGLWGSSFSRANADSTPPFFETVLKGIKVVFKNLLFFTPRRQVIIEFEPAPSDFPYKANRPEFNKYLENWYNKPDGLIPQKEPYPGDSLILVPYSMWNKEIPKIEQSDTSQEAEAKVDVTQIPEEVQKKVYQKLAELSRAKVDTIKPEMNLAADLCLDSLDIAEIMAFLHDEFDQDNASPQDLSSVAKVLGLASKQITGNKLPEDVEVVNLSKWHEPVQKIRTTIAEGKTIPEVFLNNCNRKGQGIACADMRAGVITYPQIKMRTLILADYIRNLPGEYVGIMLPASAAASMTILACQLAGKIPLMINWTVGSRHLQSVQQLTNVQVVLTSWAFLDRLQNVDLTGIEDQLVMLEDVRRAIQLPAKLKGFFLSKLNTKAILKAFNLDKANENNTAVLLFTSGTESQPKGVPLSHRNILSNQRACLEMMEIFSDDILLGILPPFHSFGFTISGLTGLLAGFRIAFSPDPTDGPQLAKDFERWGATIICGAPTFIRKMLKAAQPEQLKTMRLCITGAEKTPPDLVQAMNQIGKADKLMEGYGITECAPVLTGTWLNAPKKGVGKPLPNIQLCIVNPESYEPLPHGHQGLILAKGPNIFSRYLNPGLTSPFVSVQGEQWYNTGDLGSLDLEGNLILSDRLKRFVKVGGEMVSLTSIEDALHVLAHSKGLGLTEDGPILAICGKEVPGEKPKISLFCKFGTDTDEANKILKEAGFSNLVKITSVMRLQEIPIMGTGKINYRALEALDQKNGNKI